MQQKLVHTRHQNFAFHKTFTHAQTKLCTKVKAKKVLLKQCKFLEVTQNPQLENEGFKFVEFQRKHVMTFLLQQKLRQSRNSMKWKGLSAVILPCFQRKGQPAPVVMILFESRNSMKWNGLSTFIWALFSINVSVTSKRCLMNFLAVHFES